MGASRTKPIEVLVGVHGRSRELEKAEVPEPVIEHLRVLVARVSETVSVTVVLACVGNIGAVVLAHGYAVLVGVLLNDRIRVRRFAISNGRIGPSCVLRRGIVGGFGIRGGP